MLSDPPGPYFSLALLYAVQAQASRHESSQDKGWKYAVCLLLRFIVPANMYPHRTRQMFWS